MGRPRPTRLVAIAGAAALLAAALAAGLATFGAPRPAGEMAHCEGPDAASAFTCRNTWLAFLRRSYR
jgi:hypothetical protein